MNKNQNELAKVYKIATDLDKQNLAEVNQLALKLQNKFNTSLNTKLSQINAQMIQNTDLQLVYKKSQEALKICTTDIVNQISQIEIPKINYDLHAIFQKIAEKNRFTMMQTLKSIDFKDIENTLSEYTNLLIEHQLPPFYKLEYIEIRNLIKIEDKTEIRQVLVEHMMRIYDECRITNRLEKWKSFHIAKKRIHIFEEIIWAHQNKKYNIAIPALISQFEGLVCDIFEDQNIKVKQYLEKIFQGNDEDKISQISKRFWIEVLLEKPQSGKNRFLSRHAILHGEDINYGNYEKSLILIITMDAILELFNDIPKEVITNFRKNKKSLKSQD